MIQTCVLAVQEELLQQVLIVLHTMPTFAAAALPEKSALLELRVQQLMLNAKNVFRGKQRQELMLRVRHVQLVSTKIKMVQEQHTVVTIALRASTAIKPDKVPVPPANRALLVVGLPRRVLKSVPELLALRVLWASTIP